jgi:signal transduction histidine kinase
MSHELRTPLNSIIGFSSLLSTGMAGPLTEEQVLQTTRIHTSGHQLLQLINEILDLSTIEAGVIRVEIERIDAGAIAADVAETLRPLAEQKSIGLRVELPPGRIEMVTDGDRLRQILMNLVGNAVKFTASGEVELRAEYGNDSRVSFVVSDTGPGIPADEIESIFEAFRQVENVRNHRPQGTGLGLTISANLARRLGGEIVVSSEVGAGSVFTLWLPVCERLRIHTAQECPEPGGVVEDPGVCKFVQQERVNQLWRQEHQRAVERYRAARRAAPPPRACAGDSHVRVLEAMRLGEL